MSCKCSAPLPFRINRRTVILPSNTHYRLVVNKKASLCIICTISCHRHPLFPNLSFQILCSMLMLYVHRCSRCSPDLGPLCLALGILHARYLSCLFSSQRMDNLFLNSTRTTSASIPSPKLLARSARDMFGISNAPNPDYNSSSFSADVLSVSTICFKSSSLNETQLAISSFSRS